MLRVVLADRNRQLMRALRTMLQEQPGLEIVGEAADVDGLFALTEEVTADLVMVDGKLPGSQIKELITDLHGLKPRPIVIVMSAGFEDSRIALQAGADAFVSKGDQPDWLLETLRHYTRQAGNTNGL